MARKDDKYESVNITEIKHVVSYVCPKAGNIVNTDSSKSSIVIEKWEVRYSEVTSDGGTSFEIYDCPSCGKYHRDMSISL